MANRVQLEAILKFVGVQVNAGVFNQISRAAAGMPGPVQQFNKNLNQSAAAATQVTRAIRGTNTQLSQSSQIANTFLRRMTQFAILLPIFASMNKALQGGVKFLFDFDATIRDIIKADISKLGTKFDEVAKSAMNLSKEFGTSALVSADTIKTYIQAGYDLQQANELARLSILGVKSSTLDAAQAVEFLLSASKQFGLEGGGLEKALDALVNVEGVSAVEAKDVAEAFSTAGNSFAQFAGNINDSIGLISALREQTRKSGSEIGTFFKTLQARIFAAGDSRSALEALGVTVQNLDGSLRPTLDVLNDLKAAFDGMTEAEQANAAKSIAGVRQFESLLGVMKSLKRANELSNEASLSAGEASRKQAIDADKLQRSLDQLIVAGQEFAAALGKAGASNAFKDILKTATSIVDALTAAVNTLDKMGVSVLPIVAAFGALGAQKAFQMGGFAGGAAVAGGAKTGSATPAAPTSKSPTGTILLGGGMVTGLGSHLGPGSMTTFASSATVASKGILGFAEKINKTTGILDNTGAGYLKLAIASTAAAAGLHLLAGAIGGSTGKVIDMGANALQTGMQFSMLGDSMAQKLKFGSIALAATAVIESFATIKKAIDEDNIAIKERTETEKHLKAIREGTTKLSESSGAKEAFLSTIGNKVGGRSSTNTNMNRVLSEAAGAATSAEPALKSFITDVQDMRDVFYQGGEAGNSLRTSLAQMNSEAFVNKDAIEAYRASIQENGLSSLTTADQIKYLLKALGQLQDGTAALTEVARAAYISFKDMKATQEIVKLGQTVNNLGRDLEAASKAPGHLLEGIDLLQAQAKYAKEDLVNASASFDKLRASLTASQEAADAGFSVEQAKGFFNTLNSLMSEKNGGQDIDKFISSRSKPQQELAKEFIKLTEDQRKAVIESKSAEQAASEELYKHNIEMIQNQRDASYAAAEGLAKFQSELLDLGTTSANIDISQFSKLKGSDMAAVFAGTSDLPKAIQDVINNSFVDPVKKAEQNLSAIAAQTAASLVPLDLQMKDLRTEIAKLSNAAPNTTDAFKRQTLETKLAEVAESRLTKEREGVVKGLSAAAALSVAYKKATEEAARAEAERLKKTQALNVATKAFSKSVHDVTKGFQEFAKQRIDDLSQKQASAYEEVKTAEQGVLSATHDVSAAYKEYISTIIQVNGVIAEAKVKANLLGRDIGMLNGGIVTFQDKLGSLNHAFTDVLNDANMKLDQRIQLEKQLADDTLAFLKQAQDQIVNAGVNVFGQSAGENQNLQKGLSGLSYVADKLGGSFKNFLGMDPQQISGLSKELLNLPVEFRKSVLDALAFLPSTASIGGFSADQLKQAIGQVGAGVAPEQGLPAIAELTSQQVEQMKILGQLTTQEAKMQITQVLVAQKQLDKAEEQLNIAKIQDDRAREGFAQVQVAVNNEMAVISEAAAQNRDLLQKVVEAGNANSLSEIQDQAQLFADQNAVFREVGGQIVQGIGQAVSAKMNMLDAQTSLNTFNQLQALPNEARGFIPNFANGNLSVGEAAGLLRAAAREKRMMPNGAQLAVANTHEAVIPMYKNFAGGNAQGSEIAAGINSIRTMDQTMVAAIARSVTNSLSQLSGKGGDSQALDKIATLLTDVNTSLGQVRDSNAVIKNNTAGLAPTTTGKTGGAPAAVGGQEIKITLQTNQNNTVQITGLEALRDQLKQAIAETTSKQVAQQLEGLMSQLDPVFQALNERGIISSFGQSR